MFDGNNLHLHGDKKYLLANHTEDGECCFTVEAKAGRLDGNVTYPRYMNVHIFGMNIRLDQDGKVKVR